jgi:hypothetical protein
MLSFGFYERPIFFEWRRILGLDQNSLPPHDFTKASRERWPSEGGLPLLLQDDWFAFVRLGVVTQLTLG